MFWKIERALNLWAAKRMRLETYEMIGDNQTMKAKPTIILNGTLDHQFSHTNCGDSVFKLYYFLVKHVGDDTIQDISNQAQEWVSDKSRRGAKTSKKPKESGTFFDVPLNLDDDMDNVLI